MTDFNFYPKNVLHKCLMVTKPCCFGHRIKYLLIKYLIFPFLISLEGIPRKGFTFCLEKEENY